MSNVSISAVFYSILHTHRGVERVWFVSAAGFWTKVLTASAKGGLSNPVF